MNQLRWDPTLGEWVAYATHRQDRTFLPPAEYCPLDPTKPGGFPTEVPRDSYDIAVFENKFPSLSPDAPEPEGEGSVLTPAAAGRGVCEVVLYSDDHYSTLATMPERRIRNLVEVWADRYEELGALPFVEYVFIFENKGEAIGVTLHHPHGQIYAYPFVTPRTRRMLEAARRHRERTGSSVFADVLAAERASGARVVAEGAHWTAFVPAAARWPVEVHLFPHRAVPDIPALTDAERDDFSTLYLDVLRRMDALYDAPLPYIAAWQQAPAHVDRDLAHLHLQVFSIRRAPGKLKYLAGSESGMGAFINDVLPEVTAQRLRDAGGPA